MSNSVDNRVVGLQFDNKQFEAGTKTSLSTLDRLKQALRMDGATKGLENIKAAGQNIIPESAQKAVGGLSAKFVALSTVAITALSRITNTAITMGTNLVKSLTIDPIKQGLSEYETNLNSIQTIMSNTGKSGKAGLAQVNKALQILNTYSDKTIYNFSEMARNIGTFTAAGVDLKTSTAAIKGIANLAAVSGSSSEQASTAMYQLSQALASGTVKLMDWNSVVNAGMGGKVFQKAIMETARVHGVGIDKMIKQDGSFRETLKHGWLTSSILTESLNKFTGDLSASQLKSMGYNKQQIAGILKMGKTAQDAATKVKTASQLINTLQEAVGSGWAQTWQILFGDFNEAKSLFTGLSNTFGGFITASANARNKVLGDWKKLGGRTVLIQAISNVFHGLLSVLKPIRDAFRAIFPPKTGKDLYNLTVSIEKFTEGLKMGAAASKGLKGTFAGFFAILDIGKQIVSGIIGFIVRLFGVVGDGSGSIFQLTGSIGDLLVALDQWLKKNDVIGKFFDKLSGISGTVLKPVVSAFKSLAGFVSHLVSGGLDTFMSGMSVAADKLGPILATVRKDAEAFFSVVSDAVGPLMPVLGRLGKALAAAFAFGGSGGPTKTVAAVKTLHKAIEPVADLGDRIKAAWDDVKAAFSSIADYLRPVGDAIVGGFKAIKDRVTGFVSNMGIQDGLAIVNTGFFIAFYNMMRKFTGSLKELVESARGTFDKAGNVFDQLTSNLKSMQTSIRADAILKIAGALAVLAAALWVLSKVNTKQLGTGLAAVGIMLIFMTKALSKLDAMFTGKGLVSAGKMVVISAALVALGLAVLAMAAAVAVFGHMDLKTLAKGLGSVAATIAVMVGGAALLEKAGGARQLLVASAALIILSAALTALAGAVLLYSKVNTKKLADGSKKIFLAIASIAIAMRLMPKDPLKTAAALAIVALSLTLLQKSMKAFASMSGGDMVKSLVMLNVMMMTLVAAMNAVEGSLLGAAALLVVSASIVVLAKAMAVLGAMSIWQIIKALIALAGGIVILGLAAAVLTPIVPIMLALGIAVGALGAGAFLAGAGLLAFATGLSILAVSGVAGAAALTAAIITIAEAFPLIMEQVGLGIKAFAKVIAESGPPLLAAFATILGSLIDAVIKVLPKIGALIKKLIAVILDVLVTSLPQIQQAGYTLLVRLLQGVARNIGEVADAATDVIIAFIKAIGRNAVKMANAGADTLIDFVNGIADAVDTHSEELGEAGGNLADSLVMGMVRGIGAMAYKVVDAAKALAYKALNAFFDIFDVNSPSKETHKIGEYVGEGLANGMTAYTSVVVSSAKGVAKSALDTIRDSMVHIGDVVSGDVEMSPVITPVIDLTEYQKGIAKMGVMNNTPKIDTKSTYEAATAVSAAEADRSSQPAPSTGMSIVQNFEQTINSPEPVSTTEVYRQTKNQLSQAKTAVGAVTG